MELESKGAGYKLIHTICGCLECAASFNQLDLITTLSDNRRHHELISKFNFVLKSLLHQGLSEPENLMVTWYTNSKRLWVGLIFVISFEK